eukprot:6454843-Amphidinium_carterae.1
MNSQHPLLVSRMPVRTIEDEWMGARAQVNSQRLVLPQVREQVDARSGQLGALDPCGRTNQRGPGWQRVKCLEPGEAAAGPKTIAQANEARGKPLIYKWGTHMSNIDSWADNVFTYLKRCALATKIGDAEVSLDTVIRTSHAQAIGRRPLPEAFAGFQGHPKWDGVYSLECQNAFLSCRSIGQTVAVHQPQATPSPLMTGELVSLCHALLALVDPETYDRSSKMGRTMTTEAIQHRNNLVPKLTAALKKLK